MNYNLIAYAQDFASYLLQNVGKSAERVRQIILFGSVARGEADRKSDVDIFIDVTDESVEDAILSVNEQFAESVKVKKYWALLDVKNKINCTVGKLEEWDSLQRSLIADGIVLYGKYQREPELKPYCLFIVNPGKKRSANLRVWRSLYGYTQKAGKKIYRKKGLVKEYEGKKLGNAIFVIPAVHAQKMRHFLRKEKFQHQIIPFWSE